MEIPITILADEKGYYDRECPNENCLFTFKVFMDDWKEKVSDDEVHCPMCGHIDTSDKWYTQQQLDEIKKIATDYAMSEFVGEIEKTFSNLAKSTRGNKFVQIKYKPGKRISFSNNPIGHSKEWELDITCKKCGTRYSVIGSAFFCPCCGYNSAINNFDESLDSIKKKLDSIDEMKTLFSEKFGNDKAETMCRELVERSIDEIVSSFQKFAACLYEELSQNEIRVNDFQIVDKGSELFESISETDYSTWLTGSELREMRILFQKRHLIEHNNCIVDEKYINKTGDSSYRIGQRIVIRKTDAYNLLNIVRKLGDGLITLINEKV